MEKLGIQKQWNENEGRKVRYSYADKLMLVTVDKSVVFACYYQYIEKGQHTRYPLYSLLVTVSPQAVEGEQFLETSGF